MPQNVGLLRGLQPKSLWRKLLQLPNFKNLMQINRLGIEHSRERQLSINRGGYMKDAMLAVGLPTLACFSSPVLAQQQELQEVMDAANALSARENELLSKKEAAGIASLFTSDGLLVMLGPQYEFKPGRDAILKHYQGIIDAGATSITLELKNMELLPPVERPRRAAPAPLPNHRNLLQCVRSDDQRASHASDKSVPLHAQPAP